MEEEDLWINEQNTGRNSDSANSTFSAEAVSKKIGEILQLMSTLVYSSGELSWSKLILLFVAVIVLCFAIVVGYNCVNQKFCSYDFEPNLVVKMLGTLCKIFAW